jgi:hypothetical protein
VRTRCLLGSSPQRHGSTHALGLVGSAATHDDALHQTGFSIYDRHYDDAVQFTDLFELCQFVLP